MTEQARQEKVIGVVVCDFVRTAIGTRSRLGETLGGKRVIEHVVERLARIAGIDEIVLLVPPDQKEKADALASAGLLPLRVMDLSPRSPGIDVRVRAGRQWNLHAWRGGAGQYTVFDEEYHPAAIAEAAAATSADHVLVVHSHGVFLDVDLTAALVQHHLHKNHEMRLTYTPSAPGLSGMLLRGDIVREMGEKHVLPWQLLAYDPAQPNFDTLIREACMQVDPALSKIPNRLCVDTDRGWTLAQGLLGQGPFQSASAMALAAARTVAPGVRALGRIHGQPRELEIELTGRRLTTPPGSVPAAIREARGELDLAHWQRWFAGQHLWDDVLITLGGDGDPLLYRDFPAVLQAARDAGAMGICLQTDLACDNIDPLVAALEAGLLDVLGVTTYGHTAATYARVAQADLHAIVMKNLTRLAPLVTRRGGVPLVVPRLLKVRDTIPEMETFFDLWLQQSGWAVIDAPTDRAGGIPFAGVIDMAPPKRRPCRRLWDRMLLRANGLAVACDQDMHDRLPLGNIAAQSLEQLWSSSPFANLRAQHAEGHWDTITPCKSCREWHRP